MPNRRRLTGIALAAILAAIYPAAIASAPTASAAVDLSGTLTFGPDVGGAFTVNPNGHITAATASVTNPALRVITATPTFDIEAPAGTAAHFVNPVLPVLFGGWASIAPIMFDVGPLTFTFTRAEADSLVPTNTATGTSGTFNLALWGTLTGDASGTYNPGAPSVFSEACTESVISHSIGGTGCAASQIAVAAPEPASLAILGTALAGFGLLRRRKRA